MWHRISVGTALIVPLRAVPLHSVRFDEKSSHLEAAAEPSLSLSPSLALWPFQKDSILATDLSRTIGRTAMNAVPRSMAKKLEAKKKPVASHPLKELNRGTFLPPPPAPPIGAAGASKGGCFRFFDSSAKEPPARSKPVTGTPRSAPSNTRNATFNPKNTAKASGSRTSQKGASRSGFGVPKQIVSGKFIKQSNTDLLQKWSKRKPSSDVKDPSPKFDLEPVGLCPASSPKRTLLSFNAHEEADEEKQMLTTTPTSTTTPPVEASISPEVPMDNPSITPTCFAAGHVIVGVHDRRKCRPRGILSIGGRQLEIPEVSRRVSDPTRVSLTPPPLSGASIHWLSSPPENANSGHRRSLSSSSRIRVAHCPVDSWKLSPSNCSSCKSPELSGLLDLNSPCLETTPSPGVMVQRTPSSGGSVSPFSLILEKIAKTSRRNNHLLSQNYLIEDHVTGTPSTRSSSINSNGFSDFKVDAAANVLKNVSLSSRQQQKHNASCQTTFSGLSFQFGSVETSSNSVDLNRFQHPPPGNNCAEEEVLGGAETRISWREGLMSRIFEMGNLDGYRWFSDDEEDLNCLEEDRVGSISDLKFDMESSRANVENLNEHNAAGFGSIEFMFEAEKGGAKGPAQGPILSAESISMEGIGLAASDDSDWTFSYQNHLFEV
ncbi:hypothetical protein ZIOFF_014013 [Zingiber officinale]|uniref:Uncharacterized protein n=1 Tax=Zingiber officinale TaxID=94328 RepID=A0A8J5I040_ZINOF|nr:hypothetical protein ZIOFF_014013 [Zingiber officinale]